MEKEINTGSNKLKCTIVENTTVLLAFNLILYSLSTVFINETLIFKEYIIYSISMIQYQYTVIVNLFISLISIQYSTGI